MICTHDDFPLIYSMGGGVRCFSCGVRAYIGDIEGIGGMSRSQVDDIARMMIEAEAIKADTPKSDGA